MSVSPFWRFQSSQDFLRDACVDIVVNLIYRSRFTRSSTKLLAVVLSDTKLVF